MTIKITSFTRKPFPVHGVRVAAENISEVAEWCGGEVRLTPAKAAPSGETGQEQYIKVDVNRPLNEKQTRAFVGDWVLQAETGFKVYTHRAMLNSFDELLVYTDEDATAQLEG